MFLSDSSFNTLLRRLPGMFIGGSYKFAPGTWQGQDVSKRPEMVSYDLLNFDCCVNLMGNEALDAYRQSIKPNLPWADNHFEERVCGYPINPGTEWENWPWAQSAGEFLNEEGMFNHNYMERLWPKMAGNVPPAKTVAELRRQVPRFDGLANMGIREDLNDLGDLVAMLATTRDTRKAFIPLFFPEDTGRGKERNPCTLGYQFRWTPDHKLHIWYPMRSCDVIRHFRDDIYMAVRLLLWVLDRCREIDPYWKSVGPGTYSMHCTSLHLFKNDWRTFCGTEAP